ncbi:cellulose-binding family II [Cellulomonas flavigena DSM 20109]|uniref:Cellulose-binding family II n=1 Tax=Cellulomonas flavigena (strain ATCC 482 / DSM 20109 / BCRC 11376 / JCM 18109 / NBRC 3775 / NCIMB 8073 / NRS 134) TaxID=446466 RepID=D5UKW7_CELFN|nr:DUF6055 domain-containing protein [Cellulomonas flavigena]ADG73935.1 cellulose-binding family II [Cellulomonas flavigena DSM 20109]
MGRFRRGTLVVALVVAFVLGAVLATALGTGVAGPKDLVVPDGWRTAWRSAHVVEGDDVALAWGDRAGEDPTAAPEGLRFDPDVVLAQLEALHALDVDALGLGAPGGPLATRKLLVVVDGTWSAGPGATADMAPVVGGGLSVGADAVPLTQGAVVDGVALLRVRPEVLAGSVGDDAPASDAGGVVAATRDATPHATPDATAGARARAPQGTPWELARGVAETLQHLTEAAHPGHGLTPEAADVLRPAASAYLATYAVRGEHADVSDHVLAPQLAWGSPRHGAAGWLLLQHLADRESPTLVQRLWTESLETEHVLAAYARLTQSDASGLNRRVAQYAMRAAVADVSGAGGPGDLLERLDPVLVAHRTTPTEAVPDDPGHHRVTGAFAPAAYGYTVVRLTPDGSGADVRVRVRGHAEELAGKDPGWSFGLVAVGASGPRYGPVTEAVDGELRLALHPGEDELYLVVAATPTRVVAPTAEGFARTTRYPYEFRVAGAAVAEPDVADVAGGHAHPNGGGWVADDADVDPAAYVAAGAVVRGDATVGPGVRLEGRAWVEAGAELTGDVVVRDAAVVRGTARLTGHVLVGGDAVVGFACDAGAYTSYRPTATCDPGAVDTDVNTVVMPFAPSDTRLSTAAATIAPSPEPAPGQTPTPAPASADAPSPSGPATTPDTVPPPAAATSPGVAAPPAAVPAGACTASYQVVTSWPGGLQVQLVVTATTSGVNGWVLTWTQPLGLEMADSWGAEITRSGRTVTAENLSWNGSIANGGSVTLGFNAAAEGESALEVPQVRCEHTG